MGARRGIGITLLLTAMGIALACTGRRQAGSDEGCPPGAEGCTCRVGAVCDDGLACVANECVGSATSGDAGANGADATGGALTTGGTGGRSFGTGGAGAMQPSGGGTGGSAQSGGGTGGLIVPAQPRYCRLVECITDDDCCADFEPPLSVCDTYDVECQSGDELSCYSYLRDCLCPLDCQNEMCVARNYCVHDSDCPGGICIRPECGECLTDADCPVAAPCINNECQIRCTQDEQCGQFEVCIDGECVWVGCQNHSECMAVTGDVGANCVDGNCRLPCDGDYECAPDFEACVDGLCAFIGCQSDEQCAEYFGLEDGTGTTTAMCL